jgi:hypothetical protein
MSTRRFLSGIIFLTLFVIFGYFQFRYESNQSKKELQRIYTKYPPVLVETELLNVVNDIYKPVGYKETPSLSFITFRDIGNYRVDATSYTKSGRL